jgi:prolipoprotein diacylglyceryltransferase
MRPVFVAWLIKNGWPAWLCPDYVTMVGVATLVAAWLVLRQAERDGVRVDVQARALVCTYVAALFGGYLFEWIRMIPVAIAQRSVLPIAFAGRAAYGGLIFGTVAPVLYLKWRRTPFLDFLDRATPGLGIVFACVRFGCFLEGCDFGRPTASLLGVRFPAGSPAAEAHALAGWVPAGAPSLPVHPTELYECVVGIVATLFALRALRRSRRDPSRRGVETSSPSVNVASGSRDGAAFATWLVTYAIGRFLLELLRGDVERGRYASFSTAQWVSLGILALVLGVIVARRRSRGSIAVAATALLALVVLPSEARADEPLPALPPAQPVAAPPATATPAPAAAPNEGKKEDEASSRVATIRVALASSLTLARPDVASGWAAELDALYRLRLGRKSRVDLGIEGRRYENVDAIHVSFGLVGELVLEGGRHFEVLFTFVPHHTWFDFKSEFFSDTNAYGLRYGMGAQFPIGPVVIGVTPLAFATTSSTTVGVISQWEPRLWAGVSF